MADPAGDDHGPGYYVYPTDPAYRPGSFDIVNFTVLTSESSVTLRIKFKNKFPDSRLVLQNIDIYVDKDHVSGSGEVATLPGRGADMVPESCWEEAVLITPRPRLAKGELSRIAPALSSKVIIPENYEVIGDTVMCVIPTREMGSPSGVWGYIIIVTPADVGPAQGKPSIASLSAEEPLLLRPVRKKGGGRDFGGGDPSGLSPNIIDMIVGSSESQEKVLSSYNLITRTRVVLKAVYPLEYWLKVKEKRLPDENWGTEATILAIGPDRLLTIDKGTRDGIYIGRIGKIIDDYGDEVTDVIVEQVYDTYSVCKIMKISIFSHVDERMKVKFK